MIRYFMEEPGKEVSRPEITMVARGGECKRIGTLRPREGKWHGRDGHGRGWSVLWRWRNREADPKLYGWGSEEWVHDSRLLIGEAAKRGLGISMTSGTNWSNANLTSITHRMTAPLPRILDGVIHTVGEAAERFCRRIGTKCEIQTEHCGGRRNR